METWGHLEDKEDQAFVGLTLTVRNNDDGCSFDVTLSLYPYDMNQQDAVISINLF